MQIRASIIGMYILVYKYYNQITRLPCSSILSSLCVPIKLYYSFQLHQAIGHLVVSWCSLHFLVWLCAIKYHLQLQMICLCKYFSNLNGFSFLSTNCNYDIFHSFQYIYFSWYLCIFYNILYSFSSTCNQNSHIIVA